MSIPTKVLAIPSAILITACTTSPGASTVGADTQAKAAIKAVQDSNTAAVNRRDAAAWAATFTQDATVFAANAEPVVGRAALQQFATQLFEAGAIEFKPGEFQITVAGNLAYMSFPWTLKITPASGAVVQDRGNTLDILKRQPDGSWRFHRVMWNSAVAMSQ